MQPSLAPLVPCCVYVCYDSTISTDGVNSVFKTFSGISAEVSSQHLGSMIVLDIANVSELMARPRITVTVSEEVYDFLSELAEREQRPLANLAAYLLTNAAKEHQRQKENPSPASDSKGQ